jgi:gamma-glutamyltranspeptidase / glutathione hydrolase
MRRTSLCVAAVCALLSAPTVAWGHGHGHHGHGHGHGHGGGQQAPKTPTAVGYGGAAATVDQYATNAAIQTLRRGGNAIDAAVTAAGVLGVVEPFSCGIGGGGFMVIRTAGGKVTTIDGRETAPAEMASTSFIDPATGTPLPFDTARWSGLSAGIPGTPATWGKALRKYGTISLRKALKPGAQVARKGFAIDQTFFNQVDAAKDWFDDVPSTASIYLDADGSPHDVGTTQTNPDMARTYRLLGREGMRRGFYNGPLAQAMAAAAKNPPIASTASHAWLPGLMTPNDVAAYRAPERAPVHTQYRGLDVYGMGPPSSGGSTVAEALNILEGYSPLGSDPAQAWHRVIEASRLAFADRNGYLGDPGYVDVPLSGLVSDSFAAERRALITDTAATSPVAPGDPYDNQGDPGVAAPGSATISHPRQSTTHLVVADRRGNAVSYTFTIESIGGNGVVVPGYGFLLNNELTDFNYDNPKHPNAPDGGKRPRSSMAPTIVERHGRPVLLVGSPGGSTIIGTVLEILVNRIDLGESLPDAIAAPRAVEQNSATNKTQAEPGFIASPLGQALHTQYQHEFTPTPLPGEIGAATGIEYLRHGKFLAAAEPQRRGVGSAGVVFGR